MQQPAALWLQQRPPGSVPGPAPPAPQPQQQPPAPQWLPAPSSPQPPGQQWQPPPPTPPQPQPEPHTPVPPTQHELLEPVQWPQQLSSPPQHQVVFVKTCRDAERGVTPCAYDT